MELEPRLKTQTITYYSQLQQHQIHLSYNHSNKALTPNRLPQTTWDRIMEHLQVTHLSNNNDDVVNELQRGGDNDMINNLLFLLALIPLLILPLAYANAAKTISPAADSCIRNALLAYGLLNTGDMQQREQVLNNTVALIEGHCFQR
jgi:hypothetical protein